MQSKYDNYEEGGFDGEQSTPITFTPYCAVEATLDSAFGTSSEYGDSLGVEFEDAVLLDGCLYVDSEKKKFKLFSWQRASDASPFERFNQGDEPTAADAPEQVSRTYFGDTYKYDLVGARIPEHSNEDGDVLIEASGKHRSVDFGDGSHEYGDFEDTTEPITIGDVVSWFSAGDNGPSVSTQSIAETLTTYGADAVTDEDGEFDWLRDTTGDNVIRPSLEGRRVEFFIVSRESDDDYTYNLPIFEDVETGERIRPDNRDEEGADEGGDTGNRSAATEPEPVAEFIEETDGLDLTIERADNLLTDMVESDDTNLTSEMIDDFGGRGVLIERVV